MIAMEAMNTKESLLQFYLEVGQIPIKTGQLALIQSIQTFHRGVWSFIL